MQNYSAPEGFIYDENSCMYYQSVPSYDEAGNVNQLVTWFNAESGEYTQYYYSMDGIPILQQEAQEYTKLVNETETTWQENLEYVDENQHISRKKIGYMIGVSTIVIIAMFIVCVYKFDWFGKIMMIIEDEKPHQTATDFNTDTNANTNIEDVILTENIPEEDHSEDNLELYEEDKFVLDLDEPIVWTDSTVERSVREYLNLEIGDITPNDLKVIKHMSFIGNNTYINVDELPEVDMELFRDSTNLGSIESVADFKYFTDLYRLNLMEQNISDISDLQYALSLERCSVYGNHITDVSPLAKLPLLRVLILSENYISDISSLISLQNLEKLSFSYNEVSDISFLNQLPNLQEVDMISNPITSLDGTEQIAKVSSDLSSKITVEKFEKNAAEIQRICKEYSLKDYLNDNSEYDIYDYEFTHEGCAFYPVSNFEGWYYGYENPDYYESQDENYALLLIETINYYADKDSVSMEEVRDALGDYLIEDTYYSEMDGMEIYTASAVIGDVRYTFYDAESSQDTEVTSIWASPVN
ncbi:MAG TPA: leucine-rich repeat domain-containing protein [Lachnospiraceae bacterium]|nr:leucine-rich repeat domain-containing protein [Lachnospiraceae bacterium]